MPKLYFKDTVALTMWVIPRQPTTGAKSYSVSQYYNEQTTILLSVYAHHTMFHLTAFNQNEFTHGYSVFDINPHPTASLDFLKTDHFQTAFL